MIVRVPRNLRGARVVIAKKAAPEEAHVVHPKRIGGAEAKRVVRKLIDLISRVTAS